MEIILPEFHFQLIQGFPEIPLMEIRVQLTSEKALVMTFQTQINWAGFGILLPAGLSMKGLGEETKPQDKAA